MSILGLLEDLLGWVQKLSKPMQLLFAPIIGFLTASYAIIAYTMAMLNKLILWIDERVAGMDLTVGNHHLDSVASDFWVSVNTFVPLDLMFALGTILLALRGVMAVVRIVKSFIPTIA
ncbi:hypothetical protein H5P28_07115 [Ruficoccus amylovorans]|uniref:Uncharacterized protein n=1 Tax=Ruficoccus amylovorans TaxID=1804625 RepID=A0A842HCV7_9BACT|nr:hypothetical protein [Ruficoccus amylovorans]MBC2594029.1 hypothetical protein [Ruficoccus amylovorans]